MMMMTNKDNMGAAPKLPAMRKPDTGVQTPDRGTPADRLRQLGERIDRLAEQSDLPELREIRQELDAIAAELPGEEKEEPEAGNTEYPTDQTDSFLSDMTMKGKA